MKPGRKSVLLPGGKTGRQLEKGGEAICGSLPEVAANGEESPKKKLHHKGEKKTNKKGKGFRNLGKWVGEKGRD